MTTPHVIALVANVVVCAIAFLAGRRRGRRRVVKRQRVADVQCIASYRTKPKRPRTIRPIERA